MKYLDTVRLVKLRDHLDYMKFLVKIRKANEEKDIE